MSSSCEFILDNIADYLKFISKAQSFWFTLNTSYDHGCHLASRFRLEPNDYKVLLVVTGLASYTKLGFAIKPTAWEKFLGGHQFAVGNCAIKFEQKKIDIDANIDGARLFQLKRRGFYVVQIGNKTKQSPNRIEDQRGGDRQLITPPPQLNLLRITQQSFRRTVDQYLW
jgi:hypothetical protein